MYAKVRPWAVAAMTSSCPSTYSVDRCARRTCSRTRQVEAPEPEDLDPKVMNQPYGPGQRLQRAPICGARPGSRCGRHRKGNAPDVKLADLWRPDSSGSCC